MQEEIKFTNNQCPVCKTGPPKKGEEVTLLQKHPNSKWVWMHEKCRPQFYTNNPDWVVKE